MTILEIEQHEASVPMPPVQGHKLYTVLAVILSGGRS